ncbi:hypothetical protein RJ640_024280 [Escallonia rubra]|uniref:DNA mismatch repair proteins mutS family domain-containing protein n=1 Tax=Escallonia rubra TaxID=112253 RepID=A0AA88QXK2_9ASTE|nr:hypothetical protein RJ640_024280 [Escallonia rubra]
MQRQKSILSFLKKPSPPANQDSGGGDALNGSRAPAFQPKHHGHNAAAAAPNQPAATYTSGEIRGTDTPPEKEPRRLFPANSTVNGGGQHNSGRPSLFSSIKHKFVKVQSRESSSDGSPAKNACVPSTSDNRNEPKRLLIESVAIIEKEDTINYNGQIAQGDIGCPLLVESDDDIIGPETPGMRPLVPRPKRVQEDTYTVVVKSNSSLLNTSKRVKLLEDSMTKDRNHEQACDMASKFEWLDSSRIRDASGRRPKDPLYDKRTLYIPPDVLKKMSASQKQYWSVKCQYMDIVLFFKVGKFYELYEVDAEIGHKELDWKMTLSGVGKCRQVGISESGIDDAVQKLIARGYKVGRMEQLETSEQAKARGSTSVIQRKLVHVLTPSTTSDGNIGPDAVHLLAIKEIVSLSILLLYIEGNSGLENGSTAYGFAFVDCAALKFWVGSIGDDASCAALGALLMQVSPKEVIYEGREAPVWFATLTFPGLSKEAQKALKKYSLTGSSTTQLTSAQPDADFVDAAEVRNLIKLKGYFKGSRNMWDHVLDGIAHYNVALSALGGLTSHLCRLKASTLYKFLDNCVTSSGKRLLRNWICHPLKDVEEINRRLNIVEELIPCSELIAQYLRKLPDLERLFGRIKATVKSSALLLLPLIGSKILKQRVKVFASLVKGLRVGMDLIVILQKDGHLVSLIAKVVNLPLLSGGDGLDKFLTQFEAAVDSDFPKYQNHDVKDSDAELLSILIELFIEKDSEWSQLIHAINTIDVLRSFAVTATFSCGAMSRPTIFPHSKSTDLCQKPKGPTLNIKGLWHPYALGENGGLPVPNDIHLGEVTDGYLPHTLLLTGPNMGGKSTLLRATCIAVVLAQLGCFVPCELCVLSLVDIIFTRLGATDRIMTGESTFLIECTETASVLQNATQDSLVILDELGRGTSTYDGYAIAYAVFRHLVEKVNCRLLFATHYHPLTKEFGSHPHVTLQHMACTFKLKPEDPHQVNNQELVFLYRLASGACPESYGMQVALMAGIPKRVVEAASKAGEVMKRRMGESFRSSEQRSEFSSMHEEWLKSVLTISKSEESSFAEDEFDTLFCLWHELKCSSWSDK